MSIDKYFSWFFSLVKGIVTHLDKVCFKAGNFNITYLSFVFAFFVLHIVISAFIKTGGVKDD